MLLYFKFFFWWIFWTSNLVHMFLTWRCSCKKKKKFVVEHQCFSPHEAIKVGWCELSFTGNSKVPFWLSPHCTWDPCTPRNWTSLVYYILKSPTQVLANWHVWEVINNVKCIQQQWCSISSKLTFSFSLDRGNYRFRIWLPINQYGILCVNNQSEMFEHSIF